MLSEHGEQHLFSKVQIFLGYYNLLRHVNLIYMAETPAQALGRCSYCTRRAGLPFGFSSQHALCGNLEDFPES